MTLDQLSAELEKLKALNPEAGSWPVSYDHGDGESAVDWVDFFRISQEVVLH